MRQTIEKAYRKWLIDLIYENEGDTNGYLLLCLLHKKPFYWTVPNDDNRAADGKALRDLFLEEHPQYDEIEGECTFLEFLIGLARRAAFITDEEDSDDTIDWFWRLIKNAGLLSHKLDEIEVEQTVSTILSRTYDRRGNGGLFPLKHSQKDQRKIEIWEQLQDYIRERCYI